ncbi:MAG: ATP-binding protein [Candidatus Aminicenantales bacterium]
MIETFNFSMPDFRKDAPKELMLLSIISQSFFQPFSLEDNLLVILTALTSGSGIGFNRAMLFLTDGEELEGKLWLGPKSAEEANTIWEILSTPGIGYADIIEHNRTLLSQNADALSHRIQTMTYDLSQENLMIPALAAGRREILRIKDAWNESSVDKRFLEVIRANEFLCIPLVARNDVMGEIIVDNAITGVPIEIRDIKLASICGLLAGNFIYAASLHKKMLDMEKLAFLGEMALFITHQLRNPLVAIGGFTDQLLHSPDDEAKRKRNLEIIQKEIKRLEEVVYKLAHFLKIDIRHPSPFEIHPILHSILQSSDVQEKSRGIDVQMEIEEGLPPVLCDPTYLGELIRNLLDNAIDATRRGGKIIIRVYRENKHWVVLSIKDSGIGIPPASREKLFLPFFSTKKKGIGLGLVYVKRIMDACGGKIEMESEEGKGTTFRLYFKCCANGGPQ